MISVDRGKRSVALERMTLRAKRAVTEGRQIIIFPEGTRRPPLAPAEYRYGVTRLYGELDVPCLPVALNSGLYWPRRSFVQRRGTVLLACLPAIPPGRDPQSFAEELKLAIETATAKLMAEAFRRDPALREAAALDSAAPARSTPGGASPQKRPTQGEATRLPP